MNILPKACVAAIALAVALAASAAAARPFPAPMMVHAWGGGGHPVAWRGHDGGRHDGGWRIGEENRGHHHHHGVFGLIGPLASPILEPSNEAAAAAPTPLVVVAPLTITVSIATAAAAAQKWTPSGPRLVTLRRDPPRRAYPLVVYGQ